MKKWLSIMLVCAMLCIMTSCKSNNTMSDEEIMGEEPVENQEAMMEVYNRYTERYPFDKFPLYGMKELQTFEYNIFNMGDHGYSEKYSFRYVSNIPTKDMNRFYRDLVGAESVQEVYDVEGYTLKVYINDCIDRNVTDVLLILEPPFSNTPIVNTHMQQAYEGQKLPLPDRIEECEAIGQGVVVRPQCYSYHQIYNINDHKLNKRLKEFYQKQLKGCEDYALSTNNDGERWCIICKCKDYQIHVEYDDNAFLIVITYLY